MSREKQSPTVQVFSILKPVPLHMSYMKRSYRGHSAFQIFGKNKSAAINHTLREWLACL